MRPDLELIGLSFFARSPFIADLYKNKFAQFAECGGGREAAAAPEGLVAFPYCGDEILAGDRSDIIFGTLVKTEFLRLSVGAGKIRENVFLPLQGAEPVGDVEHPAGPAGDDHNVFRA